MKPRYFLFLWLIILMGAGVGQVTRAEDWTGFYQSWDAQAIASLSAHKSTLRAVAAQLMSVTGPDHEVTFKGDVALDALPGKSRLIVIQNAVFGQWDGENLAAQLADPVARARLTQQLIAVSKMEDASGIIMDFEALPKRAGPDFQLYLTEAHPRLKAAGLSLGVCIPTDLTVAEIRAFGVADRVYLMAYDAHWPGGEAGPIAPNGWVGGEVGKVLKTLGPDRLVLVVGNYGYDWPRAGMAASVSVTTALSGKQRAQVATDPVSGNRHFSYGAADDPHQVWLLDAVSAGAQVREARAAGVRHFALWRLGSEDPEMWSVIRP